jgi:hypothetical protein
LCYAWIDKKEEVMGRTTSEENKSEWIRFRIKPSLRQKILKLQAQGDCAQLDLQDFVMVLLCGGLKIEAKIMNWEDKLMIETAAEEIQPGPEISAGNGP